MLPSMYDRVRVLDLAAGLHRLNQLLRLIISRHRTVNDGERPARNASGPGAMNLASFRTPHKIIEWA